MELKFYFDIIAITETCIDINSKNFVSEFKIEGYDLFHEDRKGRKEGGVALYIKDTLRFTVNNSVRADVSSGLVWVDILNGREKLVFGIQYNPPNLRREDTNSLLHEISRACRNKNVCFFEITILEG